MSTVNRRHFFGRLLSGGMALSLTPVASADPAPEPVVAPAETPAIESFREGSILYTWTGWRFKTNTDQQYGVWTAHDGVSGRGCYATTMGRVHPYCRGHQFDLSDLSNLGPMHPGHVALIASDPPDWFARRKAMALANLRTVMVDPSLYYPHVYYEPADWWSH